MHGEEPQLYMARSRSYTWRGAAAIRGEEPQLYMVRERRLRGVRSRSYAW